MRFLQLNFYGTNLNNLRTNTMLKTSICTLQLKMAMRAFSSTPVVSSKQWRMAHGLSGNKNAEGVLTDAPDYTFLDGRPTPLLHKQKLRMEKQQGFASRIVELCSELDFAKRKHQDDIKAKQEERDTIIRNRLKPKGKTLEKTK